MRRRKRNGTDVVSDLVRGAIAAVAATWVMGPFGVAAHATLWALDAVA